MACVCRHVLPFGIEQSAVADLNHYKFTGLNREAESGLDTATFRSYASLEGRWRNADPYNGSYDTTNPQSFNRYTYVLNNPVIFTDPDGEDNSGPGLCYLTASNCGSGGGGGGVGGGGTGLGQLQLYSDSSITWASSEVLIIPDEGDSYWAKQPSYTVSGLMPWLLAFSLPQAGTTSGQGSAPSKPSPPKVGSVVVCGGGYGQPCTPAPLPTCKELKNVGNAASAVFSAPALYATLSAITVGSGGTAFPAAGLVGGVGGTGLIVSRFINFAADYGFGCTH